MVSRKTVYSTGEVAKICHVAPRTVAKWFDTNMIRGFRVPFSRTRRITHDVLVEFLTEHNIPIPSNLRLAA